MRRGSTNPTGHGPKKGTAEPPRSEPNVQRQVDRIIERHRQTLKRLAE